MNVCVLFGSSNRTGYTYSLVKEALGIYKPTIIMLSQKQINYFDYQHKYEKDDFLDCVHTALRHDLICIATPVYWYSVSAQTKLFIDRLTDLLYFHQHLLDPLRQRVFCMLATYSTERGYATEIVEKTLKSLKINLAGTLITRNNHIPQNAVEDFQEMCLDAVIEHKTHTTW